MKHIGVVDDIQKSYGSLMFGEYVVLFNQNVLTLDEAMRIVNADEFSPYVLMIPKKTWLGLFLNQDISSYQN